MQPFATLANNTYLVTALGSQWILDHSRNLEELWESMDNDDFADERIPYWTELWPASLALGEWLGTQAAELSGKTCLDLGCGIGFTAMIGQYLGAEVLACDYVYEALETARQNCRQNACAAPQFLVMDWRMPAIAPASIAYAWGGDILYEKRAMIPILQCLQNVLTGGGRAYIAEPGRSIFKTFLELARSNGWKADKICAMPIAAITEPDAKARPIIDVGIWQLERSLP